MIARQHHRGARLGEGFRGRQTYARAGTSDECDFVFKGYVHTKLLIVLTGREAMAARLD